MNDKNRLGGPDDGSEGFVTRNGADRDHNTEKKSGSKRKLNIITAVIVAAAAVVMGIAIYNLVGIKSDYDRDAGAYESLRAYAEMPALDEQGMPLEQRKIDFDKLRSINQEIIAWITIPDTNIDYPVTRGEDNDFYIAHGFDGKENKAGAIFVDVNNAPDFSDRNTIIYGHNMKGGSMFQNLHEYEKAGFYEAHPFVFIYTPDGEEHIYRIFAAHKTAEDADTYTIGFPDDEALGEYVARMKGISDFPSDVEVGPDDDIITLSTCVSGEETNRYVLQAVKMEKSE